MKTSYRPPNVVDTKPSSYNFDCTTMYNLRDKLQINLITENFNSSLRPIKNNPKAIPIPKPTLDNLFIDHVGAEVVRSDINPTKKIPHKDYVPVYVPGYYKETGFNNMNHNNIFRKS